VHLVRPARRLIPFLILCFFIAYLDSCQCRVLQRLTMNKELGPPPPRCMVWFAGIFFFGYFIFEVPSNLILEKVGARGGWIARIMISWGVISVFICFRGLDIRKYSKIWVFSSFDNARTFYLNALHIRRRQKRDFFPGIILYLTYWFTGRGASPAGSGIHRRKTRCRLSLGGADFRIYSRHALTAPWALGRMAMAVHYRGHTILFSLGFWALRHLTDKPIEAALARARRAHRPARQELIMSAKSREAIRHYRLGEALTNPPRSRP